jgi:alpha-N-arabinofuranosidase
MGALRAANGHPAPYGVALWAVWNEVYGPWERGHTDPSTYARRVIEFAEAMKAVDPTIRIVAQGDLGSYSEIVLAEAGPAIDLLSVHHYSRHFETPLDEDDVAAYLAEGRAFEAALDGVVETIRRTPGASHVRIALDEWGWAGPVQGLAGAAFTASVLNACVRLAPWVEIGGHCCLVNPGGVVERVGETVTPNLLFDVFRLYNVAHREHSLAVVSNSAAIDVAAYGDDAGCSVLLVNVSPESVAIRIDGIESDVRLECKVVGDHGTRSIQLASAEVDLGSCELALVSTRDC